MYMIIQQHIVKCKVANYFLLWRQLPFFSLLLFIVSLCFCVTTVICVCSVHVCTITTIIFVFFLIAVCYYYLCSNIIVI